MVESVNFLLSERRKRLVRSQAMAMWRGRSQKARGLRPDQKGAKEGRSVRGISVDRSSGQEVGGAQSALL